MTTEHQPDMPPEPFDDETEAAIIEGVAQESTGPGGRMAAGESDTPIGQQTLDKLEADSQRYNAWGIGFFIVAAIIGCALVGVSYLLTVAAVSDLNAAKDPEWMLVLLVVRGAFFGGLSVGLVYGLLTVATAFIDQAARFRKRFYSAHMINYALHEFHQEIKSETVKLRQVVEVFDAWNHSVESAFSGLRFQKKTQDVAIGGRQFGVDIRQQESKNKKQRKG